MNPTSQTFTAAWEALRKAPGVVGTQGLPMDLIKAINQATGLVWYDLEPYAKLLFPVITPLRNEIPRVKGNGGTSTHWISITAVNVNNVSIGVGEGQRGGSVTTTVVNNLALYKTIGLDDSVTFEADLAAENLDDAKRLCTENLLRATMIGEEKCIIGGNASLQLGTTGTPVLAAGTAGSLATMTLSVICVALAFDAFNAVGGATAAPTSANIVPASVTRTNTDGSTLTYGGGSAQKSAAATASITGATGSCGAYVAVKQGAVGYAWFWATAGNEVLGAVTTINSVSITATATGTQTAASLPASDNSTNAYLFDGLITQITTASSGSYVASLATGTPGTGTTLTSDGAGAIVQIDTALKYFWDTSRLSPDCILVSSQELKNITNKVVAGGGTPVFRFLLDQQNPQSAQGLTINAGTVVGTYLNKYTMAGGALINVLLHPNVPAGTIIYYSRKLPYPLSNVRNLLQIKTRRDYMQIEWPQTRPQYEYSVNDNQADSALTA